MDGTINDFFNEIDQIAPPKEQQKESDWQECYDDNSGYSYYWNIKTDEVTWEMPHEFKLWKEGKACDKLNKIDIPPKASPLFPSAAPSGAKIYKIQEHSQSITSENTKLPNQNHNHGTAISNCKKMNASSPDNKTVLIPYGSDDSETEINNKSVENETPIVGPCLPNEIKDKKVSASKSNSNSEDEDIDLLTKIQSRAKVLKELGGELPPDVQKLVENNDTNLKKETSQKTKKDKKNVTGFSLLADYGDSDEEDTEPKTVQKNHVKTSQSTLFPVSKLTDETDGEMQNSRAFQRKRRIAVNFESKKIKLSSNSGPKTDGFNTVRQGLGFKSVSDEQQDDSIDLKSQKKTDYLGFKSGGVMFVKPETTPVISDDKKEESKEDTASNSEIMQKIEDTRKALTEKLMFLSEGREPASPVQVMIIQMETLYEAVKEGSLTTSYLYKWLKETCAELVKLEKDAAPSGWLLQWDRYATFCFLLTAFRYELHMPRSHYILTLQHSPMPLHLILSLLVMCFYPTIMKSQAKQFLQSRLNKRYYYHNQQTGESQWEYPQMDIVGGDEAMDISTTPPPPAGDESPLLEPSTALSVSVQPPPPPKVIPAPPPPKIAVPAPPPPPIISRSQDQKKKGKSQKNQSSISQEKLNALGEPLPPGVDSSEIGAFKPATPPLPPAQSAITTNANDALGSVLNSFYEDLASIELKAASNNNLTTASTAPTAPTAVDVSPSEIKETTQEVQVKKKKKTKVKLAQGLAMKKKGVSKLVERWKNVQKDY